METDHQKQRGHKNNGAKTTGSGLHSSQILKMFLSQRYTGEKLKAIGTHFEIGESGVSQVGRRVTDKIRKDKKLKSKIDKIARKLNV